MRDEPKSKIHILQHALGVDKYGRGSQYRSYFCTGTESDDYDDCMALCDVGLMVSHGPSEMCGGMYVFMVTSEGRLFVTRNSETPPKLTRSQKRYRDYLNNGGNESFGEWLKVSR